MKEVRPEKVGEKIHAVIFLNEGLGGGFKYFFIFTPTCENDPIGLIFFKWVETTT